MTAPLDPPAPRLTCHVLDLTRGLPAAGMALELARLDGDGPGIVATATTNADGRTDDPLLSGGAAVPGRYELTFAVGAFFATDEELPYLDEVPIRFAVAPGTDHLHVALLVTPWAYSTYRGS